MDKLIEALKDLNKVLDSVNKDLDVIIQDCKKITMIFDNEDDPMDSVEQENVEAENLEEELTNENND